MADIESKLRQDITPAPDADPLFGPAASELVRYLASIAMIAAATVVAVGVDSKVTIPNLSLVFVVTVIIAGVSLGLGPSLCSAIFGALCYRARAGRVARRRDSRTHSLASAMGGLHHQYARI